MNALVEEPNEVQNIPETPTVRISVEDTASVDSVDGVEGTGEEGTEYEWEIIEVEVESDKNENDCDISRLSGLVKNSPFLQRDR